MMIAQRKKLFSYAWLVAVMLWCAIRIGVVSVWLSQYGVNTSVFAVIEIVSSVIYGVASARTVLALVGKRRRNALLWGLASVVAYLVPDVYVFSAGRSLPLLSYVVIITLIVVIGSVGILDVRRRYVQFSKNKTGDD
jgi:cell division protein FtsX